MKQTLRLTMVAGVALGALVAGAASAADYNEAPGLAAMVADGKLPPVAERLPVNPVVLEPINEIGKYGGTWRSALKGAGDVGWIRRTVAYDPLVAFSIGWDAVVPNVAESFEANEEGTVFTFKLREGHKWSDGTPFTAHDIVFAYDYMTSDEYFESVPAHIKNVASAEAVDDLTVRLTLPEPNGLFLQRMASVDGMQPLVYQREYCSQFHIDHNPDADAQAKAAGLTGWSEALYEACDLDNWHDANRPTLFAWQPTAPYDGLSPQVTFERNPYYFKVDPEGNQLPYLDGLSMTQTASTEDIVLKALNGEIDFMNRHIASLSNKPLFFDGQEAGGFYLYETVESLMNTGTVQLNQNSENPILNELFNQKDFRVALSHAINRQELIDVLFVGQGEPWQAGPRPESRWYHERLAKQYTEYDVEKANALLDGIGLTEKDGDGFRLDKEGNRIAFRLDVTSDLKPYFPDLAELVATYWSEVGIDVDVRTNERSFVYETIQANKHDVHLWVGDGGLGDALLDPRYYLPMNIESLYALRWAKSFYDPSSDDAQEPPAGVKRQHELYAQLQSSADPENQDALMAEILDIAADEFRVIGISLPPNGYGIARNNIGNVPNLQPQAWVYPTPGPMGTAQLYIKD